MPLITTEIEIAADPAKVRQVFLDFDSYPEWAKSFFKTIEVLEGDKNNLKEGDKIKVTSISMTFSPTILKNTPSELLWRGSLPYIFTGDHRFEFRPSTSLSNPGGTHLVQSENFSGLMSFLMGSTWSMAQSTKKGFENLNADIKARAEAI